MLESQFVEQSGRIVGFRRLTSKFYPRLIGCSLEVQVFRVDIWGYSFDGLHRDCHTDLTDLTDFFLHTDLTDLTDFLGVAALRSSSLALLAKKI